MKLSFVIQFLKICLKRQLGSQKSVHQITKVISSDNLNQSAQRFFRIFSCYRSARLNTTNNSYCTILSSFLSVVFYTQLHWQDPQSINDRQSRISSYIGFCIASCTRLLLPVSFFPCTAIKSSFYFKV